MGFGVRLALILGGIVVYFVPCYIAMERQHHLRRLICAINVLLGWTVIGWVAALVMSLTGVRKSTKALDDYFGGQ